MNNVDGAPACSSCPRQKRQKGAMLKIILAASFLAISAFPCFAQSADVFVKGDSYQCWLDVRDIVHRRGSRVTEDEKHWTLQSGHFSTMAGDLVLLIHVSPDKNKKGEDGCRIYVSVSGGADLAAAGRSINDRSGSNNFRVASQISAEVASLNKSRQKKAKQQTKP
jgi:hypothetical protein